MFHRPLRCESGMQLIPLWHISSRAFWVWMGFIQIFMKGHFNNTVFWCYQVHLSLLNWFSFKKIGQNSRIRVTHHKIEAIWLYMCSLPAKQKHALVKRGEGAIRGCTVKVIALLLYCCALTLQRWSWLGICSCMGRSRSTHKSTAAVCVLLKSAV